MLKDAARARLSERIRSMHKAQFDMAEHRRKLLRLAAQTEALRDALGGDTVEQEAIEAEFDAVHGTGGFQTTISRLNDVFDAARQAAAALPPAQSRPAVRLAVSTLLHLAALDGEPRPSGYAQGSFVPDALSVLKDAGVVVTADAVRKALAIAWDTFDTTCPPPDVAALLWEIERAE
jgi:hypothetical protein